MAQRQRRPAQQRQTAAQRAYRTRPRQPVVYRTTAAQHQQGKKLRGPRERVSEHPAARHAVKTLKGDPAHLVMAEFIAAVAIIGMRTIGQYEPRASGTQKGVIAPSPGQSGPLTMLAATMIVFFLLSLLAIGGGTRAKVASVLGLIYVLAMLLHSSTEMTKLTSYLQQTGKGASSPGGGPGPGNPDSPISQPPSKSKTTTPPQQVTCGAPHHIWNLFFLPMTCDGPCYYDPLTNQCRPNTSQGL
jgi:hypothetical protein